MTAQPDPTEPRWQRRPDARPDEILAAAQAVFTEYGYARAKLDEVARRAGVSKGTLYLYFDSKEALFREMVRAGIVRFVEEAEARVLGYQGSSRDLLVEMMTRFWETLYRGDKICISRLVQSELGAFPELVRFYVDEVIVRGRRLMASVIERGIAAGEFRPEARQFAARGIPGLLVHVAQFQRFFSEYDPDALSNDEALRGAIDLALHGVSAPSAARGG